MSRTPWPMVCAACLALVLPLVACAVAPLETPGPGTPQAGGTQSLPTLAVVTGAAATRRRLPTLAPLPATATPGVIVQIDPAAAADAVQPPPTVCTNTPIPRTPAPWQSPYPDQGTPGPPWQDGAPPWATQLPESGDAPVFYPQGDAPVFTNVKVALIVPGGGKIGCGDGVLLVDQQIPPTQAPLTAAINRLLALRYQTYGQSGLYNALYQSDLEVQSAAVKDGVAIIRLTGQLKLGGECDDPRVAAQLDTTARQFSTVRVSQITVNGRPLKDVLSGK
jgi:hypothetical protein